MPRHALEFVGLCRAAFLHAVEPVCLSDLRLVAELGEDYRAGELTAEMVLTNSWRNWRGCSSELTCLTEVGWWWMLTSPTRWRQGRSRHGAADLLHEVETWNDERPYLYTAVLRLICEGQRVQELRQRIPRRLELRNERPTLNGHPVKFRGVDHLTYHPEHGMYTPEPWLRDCLTWMKRADLNAIRTRCFSRRS